MVCLVCVWVARPAAPPRRDPRGLGRRRGRLRGAAVAFLCTPSLTNADDGEEFCGRGGAARAGAAAALQGLRG